MTRFVRQCKIFDVKNCPTPETPPLCPLKTVRAQYGCLLFNCTQDESPSDSGSSDLGTDSVVAIWLTGGFLFLLLSMILGFAFWAVCSQKRWPRWPLICVLLNLMSFAFGSQQIFRNFERVFAYLPGVVRNRIKRIFMLLFNRFLRWTLAYIWNSSHPRRAVEGARSAEDPEMGLTAPISPESTFNLTATSSSFNRTMGGSLPNFSQIFRFSTPRRNRTPVRQQNRLYPDLSRFLSDLDPSSNNYASSSNFTNSNLSPSLRPTAPDFHDHPQPISDSPCDAFFTGPTSTPQTLQMPPTPSFFYDPDNYPDPTPPSDAESLFMDNGFRQDSNTSPQSPPYRHFPEVLQVPSLPFDLNDLAPELARYFLPSVIRTLNFDETVETPETDVQPRLCPYCTSCLTNTNLETLSCICSSFHQTALSPTISFHATPPPPTPRPKRSRRSPSSRAFTYSRPSSSPPPTPSFQLDISDRQQLSIEPDQHQISTQSLTDFSFGRFFWPTNASLQFLNESIQISETTSLFEFSAVSRFSLVFRRTQSTPANLEFSYPRYPVRNCKRNREIGIDVNNILAFRLRKKMKKNCTFCD